MRLDKYLCDCGLGTRSEVKTLIKKGQIRVNDEVIKDAGFSVNESSDSVSFQNKAVQYKKYTYYVLNKPQGVVSTKEQDGEKSAYDFLPENLKNNLSAVGRLDKDTEGLLLFTDDGDLNHRLLSPKSHVWKTYEVTCEKDVTEEDLKLLSEGITIDGELTLPAKAAYLDAKNKISLSICEGRFHQVKKMLQATCNKVVFLKRTAFGKLDLNRLNLRAGSGCEIEPKDIE